MLCILFSLNQARFTNREFESLMVASRVHLAAFAKAYKSEGMYSTHLVTFDSKLEQFQSHLRIIEKKQSTSLTKVDKERDDMFRTLFSLHKDFNKMKLPAIQSAYETLLPVFSKYKDVPRHTNNVASMEIKSFLQTIQEEPYQGAIVTLGLMQMVTALISAQSAYEKAEAVANSTKSSREVGKTQLLRQELLEIYDLFLRYTAASAEAYPDKAYFSKLLKDLNHVRRNQRPAEKSSKRKASDVPASLG